MDRFGVDRFGVLRPINYFTKRGGLRKYFQGHEYMLKNTGTGGVRYYTCVKNHRYGCNGRLRRTRTGEYIVTQPHMRICRMRDQQPAGARPPPTTRSIRAPRTLVGPVRPKPISAPSISDSDLSSEADEEEVNDDKPQLEKRHLALKVEIGQLKKRKIKQDLHHDEEIRHLHKRKMEQDLRHDEEITELKKRKLELKIGILERGVTKKTPSGLSVPIGKANHVTINGSNGSNGPVPPE